MKIRVIITRLAIVSLIVAALTGCAGTGSSSSQDRQYVAQQRANDRAAREEERAYRKTVDSRFPNAAMGEASGAKKSEFLRDDEFVFTRGADPAPSFDGKQRVASAGGLQLQQARFKYQAVGKWLGKRYDSTVAAAGWGLSGSNWGNPDEYENNLAANLNGGIQSQELKSGDTKVDNRPTFNNDPNFNNHNGKYEDNKGATINKGRCKKHGPACKGNH